MKKISLILLLIAAGRAPGQPSQQSENVNMYAELYCPRSEMLLTLEGDRFSLAKQHSYGGDVI